MSDLADYLRREFAYDAWANGEVLRALRAADGDKNRSVALFSHILSAEHLWLERLTERPQSYPVWPEPDLAWCAERMEEMSRLWIAYLANPAVDDLSRLISYKNTKGESWSGTVIDILTHVIMHSAYHRGQIASHMRENGQTPAYTDFVHGVRQGMFE